jgi:hypothetical protein
MQTANGATAPQAPPPLISDAVFTGPAKQKFVEIPLDAIVPGKNPRKTFDEDKLASWPSR